MLAKGNSSSKIWCIAEKPYEKDNDKGIIFSSGFGYVWDKLWRESGIREQSYICDLSSGFDNVCNSINIHRPPIICPLGKVATALFCPDTRQRSKGEIKSETSLEKYAGSLLTSDSISYPHYIIPLLPPDAIVANWEYKFIHTQMDLGHVREEIDFYNSNNILRELDKRTIITEPDYALLTDTLRSFENEKLLSVDI